MKSDKQPIFFLHGALYNCSGRSCLNSATVKNHNPFSDSSGNAKTKVALKISTCRVNTCNTTYPFKILLTGQLHHLIGVKLSPISGVNNNAGF
jgi:hypothetical protein